MLNGACSIRLRKRWCPGCDSIRHCLCRPGELSSGHRIIRRGGGDDRSTWLALLSAIILLLAGWLRLGGVAEFLSSPVMLGFMNGAAVVIIGSQIGKLSGVGLNEENTLQRFLEWVSRLGETHPLTVTCGVAGIGILAGLR